MSTRLQIVMDEHELDEIRRAAQERGMTVSEFARQAMRTARRGSAQGDAARKLAAIRSASRHAFPTADIDQMNAEIARGHAT